MKTKFKNIKYWQYQYELYEENKLSFKARELYSFLYNHCVNFHEQGWCGLSTDNLAKNLHTSNETIKRVLAELKNKKLIIIENPGRRTKQAGESRQIYINPKNYLVEESEEVNTDNKSLKLIEQLKKDNEELKKENSRLKLEYTQSIHITELGHSLIRTGFISGEQYKIQAQELNHILLDFESWHRGGRDLTKACFNYWNAHKDTEVKNYVKYILTCIDASKNWISKKDRTVEEYEEELKKMVEGMHSENG